MLQRPHDHLPGPLAPPQLPRSQHQHRPGFYNSTVAFLQQRQEEAAREGQRRQGWEGKFLVVRVWLFLAWGVAWLSPEKQAFVELIFTVILEVEILPLPIRLNSQALLKARLGLTKACWAASLSGSLFVTSWYQGPTLQPQYFSRLHSDTHKWPWSQLDQKSMAVARLDRSPGHCVKRLQADGTDPTPYPVSLPVASSVFYLAKENILIFCSCLPKGS